MSGDKLECMPSDPPSTVPQGPLFFENWRAAVQNESPLDFKDGYECPLYSDAWVVGEQTIGPYRFINTMAHASGPSRGVVAPVMVLRVGLHAQFERPRMVKTDTSIYHGGTLSDEVAALAALALGARVEAGPTTRQFEVGDPRGRPVAYFRVAGASKRRKAWSFTLIGLGIALIAAVFAFGRTNHFLGLGLFFLGEALGIMGTLSAAWYLLSVRPVARCAVAVR